MLPSPSRDEARTSGSLLIELERMLAGPIAEPGLRDRIRTQYINLRDLENAHVEHRA